MQLGGRWNPAPPICRLTSGYLHLWRFRLDLPPTDYANLTNCLSGDEVQRYARLLIPAKQRQFLVARVRLRTILGSYLDKNPTELSFSYGEQGKPSLYQQDGLHFNLAHSGNWGLLAVTETGAVGVDIEQIDPQLDYAALVKLYFTPQETELLQAVPKIRRRRCFYRLWTVKEAHLKQLGCGISGASTTDEVWAGTARLLPVGKNYVAAFACPDTVVCVQRYEYA